MWTFAFISQTLNDDHNFLDHKYSHKARASFFAPFYCQITATVCPLNTRENSQSFTPCFRDLCPFKKKGGGMYFPFQIGPAIQCPFHIIPVVNSLLLAAWQSARREYSRRTVALVDEHRDHYRPISSSSWVLLPQPLGWP